MLPTPFTQRHDGRFLDKRQRFSLADSGNRRPFVVVEWIPQAFRAAIVDQKYIFVDVAAHAELVDPAILLTSVDHGQFGQRSPTHSYRLAADGVIDQFMMIQQGRGIGPRLAVFNVSHDHDFVIGLGQSVSAVVAARDIQ